MPYHRWTAKVLGNYVGSLFLLSALVVGIRDNPALFKPSDFPKEWAMAALFQPLGGLFGYTLGIHTHTYIYIYTYIHHPGEDRTLTLSPPSASRRFSCSLPRCSIRCPSCALSAPRAARPRRLQGRVHRDGRAVVPDDSRHRLAHVVGLHAHADRLLPAHRHLLVRTIRGSPTAGYSAVPLTCPAFAPLRGQLGRRVPRATARVDL